MIPELSLTFSFRSISLMIYLPVRNSAVSLESSKKIDSTDVVNHPLLCMTQYSKKADYSFVLFIGNKLPVMEMLCRLVLSTAVATFFDNDIWSFNLLVQCLVFHWQWQCWQRLAMTYVDNVEKGLTHVNYNKGLFVAMLAMLTKVSPITMLTKIWNGFCNLESERY